MAVEVVMPILGLTVEKGKITKWLRSEGDEVKKGEPIFEVEADKVTTEVESPASGILNSIIVPEGVEVPVLTVLAVITEKGEELPEKYKILKKSAVGEPPSPTPVYHLEGYGKDFDIAIIGAGPGGYIAAIRGAQLGAKVLLVEKSELGGTCLNSGCIPTKCFLSDIKNYQKVKNSEVFLKGSEILINVKKMVSRKNQVIETMKKGISSLLESQGVTVIKGVGSLADPKRIQVSSNGKTENYKAQHVVIASGSQPSSLPSIKFDGKLILSSDDVLEMKEIPDSILIIGGGVNGVEFATIFNGLGSKVTILEMLPQIIPTEDEEIVKGLRLILEKKGTKILTKTKVLWASQKKGKVEVKVQIDGREEVVLGQQVLVAVGRSPNTEGLGLETIGIQRDDKFIKVNSRMETNVDGVYAVGDVIGKMMLAHAASAEGIIAVENIMGRARGIDYQRIPSCIYTSPEVASVGLKESEAIQKGYHVRVGKFPYLKSGKALAIGEPEGFVKIIAEEQLGEILGVHILGEAATDLIGEYLLGMHTEVCVEDLAEVVKGHPTLSEIGTEAALDWQKRAIHTPKRTN